MNRIEEEVTILREWVGQMKQYVLGATTIILARETIEHFEKLIDLVERERFTTTELRQLQAALHAYSIRIATTEDELFTKLTKIIDARYEEGIR